jgi:opacity protein-like surface antigen
MLRLSACLVLLSTLALTSNGHAEGGFISLQSGITDSQDMDQFGTPIKIHFGPNITDQLALEFGLLDMGQASYDDPGIDFSEADRDNAPSFSNASHGEVSRQNANDDEPASSTYTGIRNIRPQGFLVMLRYRFALLDDLDFFVKTGANIWSGDYEQVEITAQVNEDGSQTVTKRTGKSRNASAVDQITGGGFLWRIGSGLSARAELETTALDSKDFERVRFQLVTLGVHYEF